ncbi:MAG TPA: TetR/AcrR family transcriptional regulator [Solirubrobacteraceae bacterium]|jgi:AcrR family transcriptional regulator/DNA-binding MarR family transcriptional regulator
MMAGGRRLGAARAAAAQSSARRNGGHGGRRTEDILLLQRARLLGAAVGLLAERGYEATSIAAICTRAGVSRKTYYEIFENREACLAAILTDAEERVLATLEQADVAGAPWRERMRGGLWILLCLADSEPALARACLIESQRGGGAVSAARQRIVRRLTHALEQGRSQSLRGDTVGALTAEAMVGAVAAVLCARLADGHAGVRELHGELMSMIVLPYLGAAAARRELSRSQPQLPGIGVARQGRHADGRDPLAGLPIRLTYRTARVLRAAAELSAQAAGASNREIAESAGVGDLGQMSKLLARLERHGLLVNAAGEHRGRGEANSWSLTSAGRKLARDIELASAPRSDRSAA